MKSSRITRAYLDPLQFSQYEQLFHAAAHEDGQVNLAELQDTSTWRSFRDFEAFLHVFALFLLRFRSFWSLICLSEGVLQEFLQQKEVKINEDRLRSVMKEAEKSLKLDSNCMFHQCFSCVVHLFPVFKQ